jgi:hypothetical protein
MSEHQVGGHRRRSFRRLRGSQLAGLRSSTAACRSRRLCWFFLARALRPAQTEHRQAAAACQNRPYPQGTSIFPTRNDVAEHLHRHAREDGIALRLTTTVNRIDPSRVAGSYRRPLVILTRAKWSSPRGTSTRPSSPSGPEKTALLASCCIPPPTATQSLCGASEYWWSALARPGSRSSYWKSRSIETRRTCPPGIPSHRSGIRFMRGARRPSAMG